MTKINCNFSSVYGSDETTKSDFVNKIPMTNFINPLIQLKSLILDNKISLIKKYYISFLIHVNGKGKYDDLKTWICKKK